MKALMSAFVTVIYLCIGSFTALVCLAALEYEGTAENVLVILFWIFGAAACGIGFANFVLGVVQIFKPKNVPYKSVMVCKIVLVPFFILNFIYCMLIFVGSLNPFLLWLLPIVIFLAILTYGILLATSAYNAGYLIYRLRTGEGSFIENIVFIILHFIYIADVVSSVVLYVKKRGELN